MLHVLNGDATRIELERSGVAGERTVWADVLHDGPTPAGLSQEHWRQVRTRHLASAGFPESEVLWRYREADAALDRFREHDEVVFWFEHDLFDQLILIRHLQWLSQQQRGGETRFSLICIDAFPGVEHFVGLGQLAPEQLAALFGTRQAITSGQIALGSRAWCAYCESDPTDLLAVLDGDTSALPFLAAALRRHLEDYPWCGDGLSRSERQILAAVDNGARSPADICRATQRMEERIFMGDTTFWQIVERLATVARPLLTLTVTPRATGLPDGTVSLTEAGRDVLAGRADHIALNGIDRWMGGVHLTDGRWRWDPQKRWLALF